MLSTVLAPPDGITYVEATSLSPSARLFAEQSPIFVRKVNLLRLWALTSSSEFLQNKRVGPGIRTSPTPKFHVPEIQAHPSPSTLITRNQNHPTS